MCSASCRADAVPLVLAAPAAALQPMARAGTDLMHGRMAVPSQGPEARGGFLCLTTPLYCTTQPNLGPLENSVLILPGTAV